MEMGYVPDDPYAGYVDDDSELEYSDAERWENQSVFYLMRRIFLSIIQGGKSHTVRVSMKVFVMGIKMKLSNQRWVSQRIRLISGLLQSTD